MIPAAVHASVERICPTCATNHNVNRGVNGGLLEPRPPKAQHLVADVDEMPRGKRLLLTRRVWRKRFTAHCLAEEQRDNLALNELTSCRRLRREARRHGTSRTLCHAAQLFAARVAQAQACVVAQSERLLDVHHILPQHSIRLNALMQRTPCVLPFSKQSLRGSALL